MNKTILSQPQLDILRGFIHSRGFKDELVVSEILDHFACKVEEQMTNDTRLDLRDAMNKAYGSFGVMGFRPVAVSFESQLSAKYNRVYWKHFRRALFSPAYLLAWLPVGYLLYEGYIWAATKGWIHILGINDLLLFSWALLFVHEVSLYIRAERRLKFRSYIQAINITDLISAAIVGILCGSIRHESGAVSRIDAWIPAVVFSLFTIFLLVRQISYLHTLHQAQEDLSNRQLQLND